MINTKIHIKKLLVIIKIGIMK